MEKIWKLSLLLLIWPGASFSTVFQCEGDNERLCAVEPQVCSKRFLSGKGIGGGGGGHYYLNVGKDVPPKGVQFSESAWDGGIHVFHGLSGKGY